jgi:branched-chain amino acid transport system ATP-binding protein
VVDMIYERLAAMAGTGLSMLLVEQHVDRALALAARGYVMDLGRVVTTSDSASLSSDRQLEAVYMGA